MLVAFGCFRLGLIRYKCVLFSVVFDVVALVVCETGRRQPKPKTTIEGFHKISLRQSLANTLKHYRREGNNHVYSELGFA